MDVCAFEVTKDQIVCFVVHDLWEATADSEVFELPLEDAISCINGFLNTFNEHDWFRVQQADLSYPIIVSDAQGVMDGCHRVMRAIIEGWVTIPAKRLITYPEPYMVFNSWEQYDKAEF